MARTKITPQEKQSRLPVRTFRLTPEVEEALRQLSQDASDLLGRRVSESAIVRASIHQVSQGGPPAADALFLLVEKELKSGVLWGRKKR